jgi:Chromo (CHRromatin Organisation MOdifier) domain
MSEGLYKIEKILDKMYSEQISSWLYHVKWEGFEETDNTWEPEENLLPLGKMLEEFNKAWEQKKKTSPPKSSEKPVQKPTKKPIVSKVKGLMELGELHGIKKHLVANKPMNLYEDKMDDIFDSKKNAEKEPKKIIKKKKTFNKPVDTLKEDTVSLISKKQLELEEEKDFEIDLSVNLFRDCRIVKGDIRKKGFSKIIGCRKRNNIVQYVVMFQNQGLVYPAVVSHFELLDKNPELLTDYVLESI